MTMTDKHEVKKKILTLRGSGKTYSQICQSLQDDGVLNAQTGKPYSSGWVQYIAKANDRRSPRRKRTTEKVAARPAKTRSNKEHVIQAIAKMTSVDSDTRMTLIELVCGL
jgi:hypothetical protein